MKSKESIGLWSTVSIGIGGMVGGGIFAVLGLAVLLARGGTPIAFLLAGVVALITSYSYAKLSVTYPSKGGTVEFLNQAFGSGIVTGGLNILLWLSYITMLSLYAYAFGSYGATFFPQEIRVVWKHLLISSIIIVLTVLNVFGSKVVGETEKWIVGFKIAILCFFIGVGIWSVDFHRLQPSTYSPPLQLVAGGMMIFLAYEGFELIANTADDVTNPKKTLPRAYFISVGFVIILYILIAIVAVGNLPLSQIIGAKDYALALSAEPVLGNFGFTLIVIAALLSTASAINATLYGSSRISYIIAKDGELPKTLEKNIWNRPIEGLLITTGLSLLVANLFDLSSISTMGSAGFLLIFGAVNWSGLRLSEVTGGRKWIPKLGIVACIFALSALVVQNVMDSPHNLVILLILVGAAFSIELIYRRATGRIIRPFYKRIHTLERRIFSRTNLGD